MKPVFSILTLAFLLFAACTENKKQVQNEEQPESELFDTDDEQTTDAVENDNDKPTRDRYSFRVAYDFADEEDEGSEVLGVNIIACVDGKETDKSFSSAELMGLPSLHADNEIKWYREDDINFDGYPDLLIYCGMGGPSFDDDFYTAYVWNPDTREFFNVDDFENILNPVFNRDDKTIKGFYNDEDGRVIETYRWDEDGKRIELVSRQTQTEPDN